MGTVSQPDLEPSGPSSKTFGLLVVVCLALSVLVFALISKNRELSTRLAEYAGGTGSVQSAELEGKRLGAGTLRDENGEQLALAPPASDQSTLLFVSSKGCDYCELAEPIWERVNSLLSGSKVRVYGLVLEATADEVDFAKYPYPLAIADDRGAAIFQQIPGVPAAILLDANGIVSRALYGGHQIGLEELAEQLLVRELRDSENAKQ